MKNIFKYKKTYILISIMLYVQSYSVHTVFDPLFPENSFKRVVMRCMKVRSIAQMIMDYTATAQDAELLYDSMIGRIIKLTDAIDSMSLSQDVSTHTDIEYLCTIVDYMIAEINYALEKHGVEERNFIKPFILSIKKKLEYALDYL